MQDQSAIDAIEAAAVPLSGVADTDAIVEAIGDARIVLLGEASHGSHEFYRARMEISKRLIRDKGFAAIAVECDWPDALSVSRYVQGRGDATSPEAAMSCYERFPRWMWRNHDVLDLVRWLHEHNAGIPALERRVGFFGLDLYSLRRSMDSVVRYLSRVDPPAAERARLRYSCFDHLAEDPQRYGYATTFGMKPDCEAEVMRQLMGISANIERYEKVDGVAGFDEAFYAQQNARVAQNAETYYRAMFEGRHESWNVRDTHMMDTLDALRQHLSRRSGEAAPKVVVWAHNSHIGDARATEMGDGGEINLGQLARERHGENQTFLLGFTTHDGSVTAASDWDMPAERKAVRPSREDSYENLMHRCRHAHAFFLPMRGNAPLLAQLSPRRLERAIGVVYLPESERLSHYFHCDLGRQFDAIVHIDHTRAVKPLDAPAEMLHEEMPETYPTGI
ncbi:erythromycin esterase family protein [Noviherbaspirillum pedocola]|uniref:Erythromycin esterase family protein n=1 Tax=Noviherbaspirillum pedocola TaxID=2801341 RepID=A0A934T1Y6_9BURK|nr:erythromycin esterase family protein [Noviherbaspirillum pedocola]MBK4737702.1 erythromycin esterase family protein [Noviherbaspirillum pedocola]